MSYVMTIGVSPDLLTPAAAEALRTGALPDGIRFSRIVDPLDAPSLASEEVGAGEAAQAPTGTVYIVAHTDAPGREAEFESAVDAVLFGREKLASKNGLTVRIAG